MNPAKTYYFDRIGFEITTGDSPIVYDRGSDLEYPMTLLFLGTWAFKDFYGKEYEFSEKPATLYEYRRCTLESANDLSDRCTGH